MSARAPGVVALIAAALAGVMTLRAPAATAAATDRLWLVPNPGTLDLIRLFEHPEDWPRARQLMDVFQFTMQHTQMPPDRIVGPNSYDALVRAGVFAKLVQWRKRTALGVWAIKEFYCTPDASGMAAAIADTERAIRAITTAGGQVNYLAMDDPYVSGLSKVCGGPDLTPTADRLQIYISAIRRDFPSIQIGWLEAYPTLGPDGFQQLIDLLKARNALPAFLQIDVDIRAVRPPRDLTAELRRIRDITASAGMPMGLIVWGYNGDADALFARDAYALANAFSLAFPTWKDMPEQISIQSWSPSATGLLITPANLPEDQPYTLTNMLIDLFRRFRGGAPSSANGTAVPR